MKKRLLLITLGLVLAFSMSGCKGKDKKVSEEVTEEHRSNVIEKDEETGEEYYLLADFEDYYECTQVKYGASFGTVTEIKKADEPDMVPNGDQSVKLEILGVEETWQQRKPSMRISTTNGFFNQTTNFANMTKFTFDIYNAQDYEACIRFYVDERIDPRDTFADRVATNANFEYNIIQIFDLKPNSWNHIEIDAEDIRQLRYDTEGKPYNVYGADALQTVGAFYIEFDRGELHEEQEVFYFDNVRAYMK